MKKLGFAITGSFCCHADGLKQLKNLADKGFEIVPLISNSVNTTDTRFGTKEELKDKIKEITGKDPISTIVGAEPLGPKGLIDAIVVAPCTGNTIAKLANGLSDNAVTMATKSLMRNNKPVILGISTNDALGLNLQNIAKLMNTKNIYFVPFWQDDFNNKPKSLVAAWEDLAETVELALEGKQIQPVIKQKK